MAEQWFRSTKSKEPVEIFSEILNILKEKSYESVLKEIKEIEAEVPIVPLKCKI